MLFMHLIIIIFSDIVYAFMLNTESGFHAFLNMFCPITERGNYDQNSIAVEKINLSKKVN